MSSGGTGAAGLTGPDALEGAAGGHVPVMHRVSQMQFAKEIQPVKTIARIYTRFVQVNKIRNKLISMVNSEVFLHI